MSFTINTKRAVWYRMELKLHASSLWIASINDGLMLPNLDNHVLEGCVSLRNPFSLLQSSVPT